MKATDRHITCVDCGEEFVGFFKRTRCEPCRKESIRKRDRERTPKRKEWKQEYDKQRRDEMGEELKEKARKAYKENPERWKRSQKRYYQMNKADLDAANKKWASNNRERSREIKKRWIKNNPIKHKLCMALGRQRRTKRFKESMIATTDLKKIESIYLRCLLRTERTGRKYEVDHKIPIALGGSHHQDNLRIVLKETNRKKGSSLILSLGGVWADNNLARETKRKLTKGNVCKY